MAAHTAAHANPFDMMNSQMSQMMGQFDRMGMGGDFGGSMLGGSIFGGGMGGDTCCGSMGGGGACSSSYSCCSYSSSSSGGGPPRVVQYTESSHGLRRPGQEAVTESQGKYSDSSGNERINVSRTIGNRCGHAPTTQTPPSLISPPTPIAALVTGAARWSRSAGPTAPSGAPTT